ncbi:MULTISPECIES: helix-turn-helix domain-containing protein [unclassified Streptococcus]|uniref:helix-turn-helix domain-containing protein n=1 Tax=unclassified Streptococcus TaxID=2608887 RepID=UPI001071FCD5|nr:MULTISPECIES: helix-turn-helix transcriptional regulator [unclassified Streptococcus]MBF0786332.1 helix-turn-helix transcriptional regulator [Streptococcus sp. 19428wC2_LYSM12]MCQ9212441.1 helix-turn-helix domain-containing protein [Streptococcus sp. B01]MCQ9213779.1 helix-turn-helix domain-containing protein [Streptococcus sp. O1]TFV06743.1 XRE family transcriptional regulator [Streptococcus sp. LYSM12]
MLLNEKIRLIRTLHQLSQEQLAERFAVSRQSISKWENGSSIPDLHMLVKIADFADISLDQLVQEEIDLPIQQDSDYLASETKPQLTTNLSIQYYLGKVCDVSLNTMWYQVLRNIKIVGLYQNMVCFEKHQRYGYFNLHRCVDILVKKEEDYTSHNQISLGKCKAYTNINRFFGGNHYPFSQVKAVHENSIELQTGIFTTTIDFEHLVFLMMK